MSSGRNISTFIYEFGIHWGPVCPFFNVVNSLQITKLLDYDMILRSYGILLRIYKTKIKRE